MGWVKIANPFYVAPGEYPTWFQIGGGEGWAREVRRQLELAPGRCWSTSQQTRFRAICGILEPWRLRSSVNSNSFAISAIAPLVEEAWRNRGAMMRPEGFPADTGWSRKKLGELVVEVRNRQLHWSIGRFEGRAKGPRFDPALIPDERLDALIQRHPDLEIVDRLRLERSRRMNAL